MEEKKFYVENGNKVDGININDINYLAILALALEPTIAPTKAEGYLMALDLYYSKNVDNFKECYCTLVKSKYGKLFLYTTIQLVLLRRQLIKAPIDDNDEELIIYNKCVEDYISQIIINKEMFCRVEENNLVFKKIV